jgi:hypothetical protein
VDVDAVLQQVARAAELVQRGSLKLPPASV